MRRAWRSTERGVLLPRLAVGTPRCTTLACRGAPRAQNRCRRFSSSARWPPRSRFFLGATSHVQAYASSGADAIAVLVVREPLVATQSKLSVRDFIGKNGSHHFGQHCANATMAATEDEISHSILRAALRAVGRTGGRPGSRPGARRSRRHLRTLKDS